MLDTNILLDVWVFDDPRTQPLHAALQARRVDWITTPAMREEWIRVLQYPHLAQRWARKALSLDQLVSEFDAAARSVAVAPRAPWVCKDPDDQKFVDLAVAHGAQLVSKDFEVLRMAKRLAQAGVRVTQETMLDGVSLGESNSIRVERACTRVA